MKHILTIYFASLKPLKIDPYPRDYQDCLKQLIKDLPVALHELENKITVLNCSLLEIDENALNYLKYQKISDFLTYDNYDYIKIEVSYENDGYDLDEDSAIGLSACVMSEIMNNMLILVCLAFPGRFNFQLGQIFYNNRPANRLDNFSSPYYESLYPDKKNYWPIINTINIIDVVRWEKKINVIKNGYGTRGIANTFTAFIYIVMKKNIEYEEQIFRTMQGLESFYCENKGDLRNQLTNKSKKFLGEWEDSKNIVGQMYDARSSFIHGSSSLKIYHSGFEYEAKLEKSYQKLNEATNLALRMLFATLHKCINEDIVKVDFSWTYKIIKS